MVSLIGPQLTLKPTAHLQFAILPPALGQLSVGPQLKHRQLVELVKFTSICQLKQETFAVLLILVAKQVMKNKLPT